MLNALKSFNFRPLLWLLPLLALLSFAVYMLKFKPVPVRMYTVAKGDIQGEVTGTGALAARVMTTISPRIQERLVAVLVDQGDRVQAGQLLARLDASELKQQVAVAAASLSAAKATFKKVSTDEARAHAVLEYAAIQQRRLTKLVAINAAAQEDLDKATESWRVAAAELKHALSSIAEAHSLILAAEQTLSLRREQLTFTELRSPYDGLVIRRDRNPGDVVVPSAAILQLIATAEIWVSAWVDETAMAALQVGQTAQVTFRSDPARQYPGEVARLGRETDPETHEFIVDVSVKQRPNNWAIGQRAEVSITTGGQSGVIVIPQSFLHWQAGKPGVFILEHGKAQWRSIELGIYGATLLAVPQGLAVDEQILKSPDALPDKPKQILINGQAVTVQ